MHIPAQELLSALEAALAAHSALPTPIVLLNRQVSPYSSSYPLEELSIELADRRTLPLIFKNLSPAALLPAAAQAKPAFLVDPRREIAVYQQLLASQQISTPELYGAHIDERCGRYWLFLERVPGVELYQIGEIATWQRVAAWLAETQVRFAAAPGLLARAQQLPLLRYDASFYHTWLHRAQTFASSQPQARARRAQLDWLATRYQRLVDTLVSLPITVVHGELYASNILIVERERALRVCPVDWEMAGLGPGLIDLAALLAGSWPEADRRLLAEAYYAALAPVAGWGLTPGSFDRALACCRIHLAVQWLGWSATWVPPPEHAHDWLAEAIALAERIDL
jgi:aminoglycoside phosphotransferase (APT) family kinase protein